MANTEPEPDAFSYPLSTGDVARTAGTSTTWVRANPAFQPRILPNGQRRYSVENVRRVLAERAARKAQK